MFDHFSHSRPRAQSGAACASACAADRRKWSSIEPIPQRRPRRTRPITAIVKESNWTQTEAAQRCGVTQARINGLLRGRVSRFSLDALVNIATAMGREVHFELQAA
jgi:predicted XRE-type DNA-binding protein